MTTITRRALGALSLAALLALTACASSNTTPATVSARLAQTPELSTFTRLAQQAGLQATLEGAGPVTVFVPNDEAFKAMSPAAMDKLSKDPEALKALVSYHVVPGLVRTTEVAGSSSLTAQSGAKLSVSKAGDFLTVDDSLVIQADLPAGNGLVQVVDRVLTPPKK